ncbi:hypothetical protein LPJ57_004742 [Coemansia sp. RSA 486]|nr:hypothetical protein LPJ57_004742 [Coemansia sp. RSA 486]KAJ2236525.1 hypothetical protein IWW45_001735 [Coemansia sp. RSA 485]
MPSFAEQQLAKYGWKQGEGLGKDRSGITRAITVSRQTDNRGVGSDSSQWTSNWWDNLYNKAATSTAPAAPATPVVVEGTSNTVDEYNGMFVKPTNNIGRNDGPVDRTKLVRHGNVHLGMGVTDEELFAACEGRMARKGARAEQSGKLRRVMGDGMPRPEVAARIEAALNGTLFETEKKMKRKRRRGTEGEGKEKERSKKKKKRRSKEKKDKTKDKKEKKEKSNT